MWVLAVDVSVCPSARRSQVGVLLKQMSTITGSINCQLCFIVLRTAVSTTKWNSSENGVHIKTHLQSIELIVID